MTQKTHSPKNELDATIAIDVLVGDEWKGIAVVEALVQECVREAIYVTCPALLNDYELEVTVSLSDNDYVRELNQKYLGKDKPTNVLSFATNNDKNWSKKITTPATMPLLLGDIILAYGIVSAEAKAQDKKLEDHVAHMVIHGCLHLLGHDHQEDSQANIMEGLERQILFGLGIGDPYGHENSDLRAEQ